MKLGMLVIAILAVVLTGCSKTATEMMRPPGAAVLIRPTEGETGVRLDSDISLTFAAPVDVEVIESGLHLFSASEMADTLCPHPAGMAHGGMSEAMRDTAVMRHMIENHPTPGWFTWSADRTRCEFHPAEPMAPLTRHLIHLGPEVMDMMEGRMPGAMMNGHGSEGMERHMMSQFVTMDSAGHAGHH